MAFIMMTGGDEKSLQISQPWKMQRWCMETARIIPYSPTHCSKTVHKST